MIRKKTNIGILLTEEYVGNIEIIYRIDMCVCLQKSYDGSLTCIKSGDAIWDG